MYSSIVILCFLGDPTIPAVSCDRAGGFNVDTKEILKYWSSSSYPITVITNTSFYAMRNFEQLYEKISLYRINLEDSYMNNQQKLKEEFPRVYKEVLECLEQNQIQPIFFHSYYWYSGLLALMLSQKYGVKFIHTIVALSADKKIAHATCHYQPQYEYECRFIPHASVIFAISNTEKQTLIQNYKCQEEIVLVVGRGVDNAFLMPDHNKYGISTKLLNQNENMWNQYLKHQAPELWWHQGAFTYIGRIKSEKGLDTIIKSWYYLYDIYRDSMIPLWIVGGYPDAINAMREKLIKLYPVLELLEKQMKLCWWGYLTPSSINTILLKSIAVVTHSQYEAGGRVIIEAMSAGKPVIATPTGFAADFIRDWKNGFLVSYGDIELLKCRMEHFIRNPLLSIPLGESAKSTYEIASKNWRYYDKHSNVYKQLYTNPTDSIKIPAEVNKEEFVNYIPAYFKHRRLYSWPDEHAAEEKILPWCRELFRTNFLQISYQEKLSNHSWVWFLSYGEKDYVIKCFYTRFKDTVIWNPNFSLSELEKAKYLFNQAVCDCSLLLSITARNEEYYCYITEKAVPLSQEEYLINYEKALHVIWQFNCSFEGSLETDGANLLTYDCLLATAFAHDSLAPLSYLKWLNKQPSVLSQLKLNDQKTHIKASYGKNFIGHIVKINSEYRLLPSAHIRGGEFGLDCAICLLELFDIANPAITDTYFNKMLSFAANLYGISELYIQHLCLLLILCAIRQQMTFKDNKNVSHLVKMWEQLLVIFRYI